MSISDVVNEGMAFVLQTAKQTVNDATEFLRQLADSAKISIPYIMNVPYGYTFPVEPSINAPQPSPMTSLKDPEKLPSIGISTISVKEENAPSFNVSAPSINLTNIPDIHIENIPSRPSINTIDIPRIDTPDIPNAPSINTDITIPDAPVIDIPEFTATLPPDTLQLPSNTFSFTEKEYTSALLDMLKDKLSKDINGATGLSPEVERDIWERQSERDAIALEESVESAINAWTQRGFSLPNGVIAAQIQELYEKYELTRIDRSREIAIAQAELAQQNTHFAIDKSIALEQLLMQYATNVADRAFNVAKTTMDIAIAIFNAQVTRYNTLVQAYRAQADVYNSLINANSAKVELYRALLEGKRVEAQMRTLPIELYKAQLDGINTKIASQRLLTEITQIQANIEASRVAIYRSQIEAYRAKVEAELAKIQAYKSKNDAEMTKVQLYNAQVNAYNGLVNAYRTKTEAFINDARAKIEAERMKLESKLADLRRLSMQHETDLARNNQELERYRGDIARYNAEIGKGEAMLRANIEQRRIVSEEIRSNLQLAVRALEQNLQAFVQIANVQVSASHSGGQIYSALAASAMSALNVIYNAYFGQVQTLNNNT